MFVCELGDVKDTNLSPVLIAVVLSWTVPLVLAMALSCTSAIQYLKYSILFMLQLPMYVSYIAAFSFARADDFSWGNRGKTSHSSPI